MMMAGEWVREDHIPKGGTREEGEREGERGKTRQGEREVETREGGEREGVREGGTREGGERKRGRD